MITSAHPTASPELMDFSQFLAWSEGARRSTPEADRYCETRIAHALRHLKPDLGSPAASSRAHRCDLVRLWCQRRGLQVHARRMLASEGVRHSLQVIFRLLVQSGAAVAIPIDVYPVYWQIASRARLSVVGFTTFPKFELSRILDAAQEAGAHHVLLPYPLKLHGRAWTNEEVATAKAWLCAGKQRRLILDSVYSFGAQLDSITKRLIESDQVVFLDSLSKAWLHEQVFGVAVIPEQDVEFYSAAFRDLAPAPAKLIVAHELLERFPDIPQQIAQELDTRRAALLGRASWAKHQLLPVERGYLVAIECSAEILLTQHSLIAIPAAAFGSRRSDWSVASALPVAGASS